MIREVFDLIGAKVAAIALAVLVALVASAIAYHEVTLRTVAAKAEKKGDEEGARRVHAEWSAQDELEEKAEKEANERYRQQENDRAVADAKAAQRRTEDAETIARLTRERDDARRLRNADSDAYSRRLADLSRAGSCAAVVQSADELRRLADQGASLVDEARGLLQAAAADLRQRDAVIAADRGTVSATPSK